MWTRAELKDRAKLNVKSFYWKSVLVAFILMLITGSNGGSAGRSSSNYNSDSSSSIFNGGPSAKVIALILGMAAIVIVLVIAITLALRVFVFNPIEVGCKKYFLDASNGNANLNNLTYSFKSNYMNIVTSIFLRDLFVFLWTLLLIIPGVIKAYQYRMIPYLLAQNPSLTFREAKERSTDIMDGEKWNTFVLDLSFILWHLLSLCTLGIVNFFWVGPYVAFTDAELYKALTNQKSNSNGNGFNNNGFNGNGYNNDNFNNNNYNGNGYNNNNYNNNGYSNNNFSNNNLDVNGNQIDNPNPYYDNK